MSTTRLKNYSFPRIFKDRWSAPDRQKNNTALPDVEPYLQVIWFQGDSLLKRKENSSQGSHWCLQVQLRYRKKSTSWFRNINLIPFR